MLFLLFKIVSFSYIYILTSRWVGRLRTVGIQRGTQAEDATDDSISEFEFPPRSEHHHGSSASSTQFEDHEDHDMFSSSFVSGSSSSTVWGSSIPSTPREGNTCTPGTSSPGAIPIGAMSLSSKYNTPRSVISMLPDEEEEEEAEAEMKANVVNGKAQESGGQVRVIDVDSGIEGEEKEVKMDVDV